MKKDKKTIVVCSLIAAVLLIGVGTFAYFRRQVGGNITGTAGNLVLKVNEVDAAASGTLSFAIKRSETENFVMPGDSGSFDVNVDVSGSSSDVEISLAITDAELPTNMKFYADSAHTQELTNKTYTIAKSANMTQSITVYWYWNGDVSDEDDSDFINVPLSANITVTATSKTANS